MDIEEDHTVTSAHSILSSTSINGIEEELEALLASVDKKFNEELNKSKELMKNLESLVDSLDEVDPLSERLKNIQREKEEAERSIAEVNKHTESLQERLAQTTLKLRNFEKEIENVGGLVDKIVDEGIDADVQL